MHDDVQTVNRPRTLGGSGVTVRGLLTGALAVPITCFVVSWAEIKLQTLQIGFLQMPPAVIGIFLLLLLINAAWKRISRRSEGLTPQDLLVTYSMMTIAAMISSRGLMEKMLPLLVTANYFTTIGGPFQPYLRKWAVPFDTTGPDKQLVALRYFEGLRAGETIPFALWVGPLLLWSVLVCLVFGAFLCMASILRRQWVDNEKLAFPLVQLPLEMAAPSGGMTAGETPFFQNRLMWIGFAIPMVVFMFKGLHSWYPAVPDITLEFMVSDYLKTAPWNGISYTPLKFSFAIVGFMFLLPSDLVFSLWFFAVLARVQDVVATAVNMDTPGMPMYPCPIFRGYQAVGAYLVLSVYLIRVAWPHLRTVGHAVLGEGAPVDDSAELFSYRASFYGFWACAVGAGLFLIFMLGMSPWIAAMQLGALFFVIAFVLARSTAEAGMLMTESSFRPVDVLRLFTPLHTLGPVNLTGMALTDSLLMRDQRGLLLGGFLDGLRIADGAQIRRRRFAGVFALAILLAIFCAAYIQLRIPYHYGGINLYGYVFQGNNQWGFNDYKPALQSGSAAVGWQGTTFLIVGVVVTALLVWGRASLSAFPFHPLGYALASSWTMTVFWFSALVAWFVKSLILRYGGMRLYRQARPFFLGMILGEFMAALLWTVANALLDTPVPTFTWS
jgi:hypothetical protein